MIHTLECLRGGLLVELTMFLELLPQLFTISSRIELGTTCNANLGQHTTGQIIAAGHIVDLLPYGNTFGIALANQLCLGIALRIEFLVTCAVLKSKCYRYLTLLIANILRRPHKDGTGQTGLLVLVRNHGRDLATNQTHTIVR